jgi:AAHS family 3-hydroxyphenylpropionic acid transporter
MTAATETAVAPIAWQARATLALCFAAALAEGYDITSMGVAAPHLAPLLRLSHAQLGPVFSASILGLFVGALAVGRLADRVGRKWTLAGSMAVFGVFSAATALAWDFNSLVAIRLAAGLGLGGAFPNLVALAAEVSSERRRTMLTTMVSAGMPFGGALASEAAASLDWKWIFWIGGAAPLLLATVMASALAESPQFSAVRAARRTGASARAGFLFALTGERRTLATACLWTATFSALMCLYVLLNWLPILLGEKGLSKHDASVVAALFNLGGGLGVLALAALMERERRSFVVVVWYAGLIVSLVLLALVGPALAAAGFTAFVAGGFASSASILLYGLAPNYYPTAIRGTGVGATVAVGRLGAVTGPLLAAGLLTAGVGQTGVLLALAPMALVAGAACLALLRAQTAAP